MRIDDLGKKPAGQNEVNWVTAIFMFLFHAGAVAALFFFSWKALAVAAFLTGAVAVWELAWISPFAHPSRGTRRPGGWNIF